MLTYEQQKAEIASLNLVDDPFFLEVMQDKECCQETLRILLKKPDLEVLSNQVDRTIPNLTGKAVKLDLICTDGSGNIINVEMQKSNDTNHQKRVRYNMASIDTLSVKKGLDYDALPDVYVVFISAFDMFQQQKTTYHIRRIIEETDTFVENGTHEIYVNTTVDDGSDIAQLMQYFKHSAGIHPLFQKLSSQVNYYKEHQEGVRHMSNAFDRYADAKMAEQAKESAINFFKNGVPIETIIKSLPSLPAEFIEQLKDTPVENTAV